MKKKVIIAGTIPPPIGGVTVHVKRLYSLLKNNDNIELINLRPQKNKGGISIKQYFTNLLGCVSLSRNGILHYQLNNWMEGCILSVLCRFMNTKMIYTVHSFRPEELSVTSKFFFNIARKNFSMLIAPSSTIKTLLLQNKIPDSKITVLNTYLPPSESELNETLPAEIIDFISKPKKVVVANAYKLYLDESNTDVYGLDMCIEACARIPEIIFVFCVPEIRDNNYLRKCKNKIMDYNLEQRFLIYNKNISLVSLFKYTDVFVRPTSTDSFGVSVAEAISCGIPAIASDVCIREEGTVLFNSRNIDDFVDKIRHCLEFKSYRHYQYAISNPVDQYTYLYNNICQ
ncbi:glycosyltransferase [Virgibacillus doumboii]|uniref:glycosyltransferase n=1 Tax=Virgibacillus doumboii TaxID=2697503 RepID=UPI0013E00B52|nr:glycosyltransferase [Virgibacillus doumboii]